MGWTWLSPAGLDRGWWGQARDSLCGPPSGLAISRHGSHLPAKLRLGAEDSQEQHPFFLPGTGQGLGTHMPEAAGTGARWDGAAVTNPWS